MLDSTIIDIKDGDRDASPPDAWVYFRLYANDLGHVAGRTARPEFATRKPACISQFSKTSLWIEVSNAGPIMSDLVVVEYQIVFCSYSGHGPTDGFATNHAGEQTSNPLERLSMTDSIPAYKSKTWEIKIPEVGDWLQNLYVRAYVSTLWSTKLPNAQWDFATMPRVTEAYLKV